MLSYIFLDVIEYIIINAIIPYVNILYSAKKYNKYMEIKIIKDIDTYDILINSSHDINNRLNNIVTNCFKKEELVPKYNSYFNPVFNYIDMKYESDTDSEMPKLIDIDSILDDIMNNTYEEDEETEDEDTEDEETEDEDTEDEETEDEETEDDDTENDDTEDDMIDTNSDIIIIEKVE